MSYSLEQLYGPAAPGETPVNSVPTPTTPARAPASTAPVASFATDTAGRAAKVKASRGMTPEEFMPQPETSMFDKVKAEATAAGKFAGREALSLADLAFGSVSMIGQVGATAVGDVKAGLSGKYFTPSQAYRAGAKFGEKHNPLEFMNNGATKLFEKATGETVEPGVSAQVMGKISNMIHRGELKVDDWTGGNVPDSAVDQVANVLMSAIPTMGAGKAVKASKSLLNGKVKLSPDEYMPTRFEKKLEKVEAKATPHTITHETHAAQMMQKFAHAADLPPEVADAYAHGARTHDFGKSLNPDISKLVESPRVLDGPERDIVRKHTDIGADFVEKEAPRALKDVSKNMARYHHERWDGEGPHKLKGEEIPHEARAMAVVDVFDALTGTDRAYRQPLSTFDAVSKMHEMGGQFDPKLMNTFTKFITKEHSDRLTPQQAQIMKAEASEYGKPPAAPAPTEGYSVAVPGKPHIVMKHSPGYAKGEADPKMLGTIAAVGLGAAAGYELYNERDRWAGALGGAGSMLGAIMIPGLKGAKDKAMSAGKHVAEGTPFTRAITEGLTKDATRLVGAMNPDVLGPKARQAGAVIAGNMVQKMRRELVTGHESETRRQFWLKQPKETQLQFNKAMEQGHVTFKDPQLKGLADGYKQIFAELQKADSSKGIVYDHMDSHVPYLFERSEEVSKFLEQKFKGKDASQASSFTRMEQAQKAGFRLKQVSPEEVVQMRVHASDVAHLKVDTFKELEQYGLVREAKGREQPAGNEVKWSIPNGKSYFVSPDVQAPLHNAFETKSLWADKGAVGMAYRGAMYAKNKIVPIRLASMFHAVHVLAGPSFADYMTTRTKLAAGGKINPLRLVPDAAGKLLFSDIYSSPKLGSEVRKAFRGEVKEGQLSSYQQTAMQYMLEGGFNPELPQEFRSNHIRAFKDALTKHSATMAVHAPFALMEALYTRPLFEEWIPNLKTAAFTRAATAAVEANPKLLVDSLARKEQFRRLSKQVEDRFGEMNYTTTLMNKTLKDVSTAGFLSYGWQLGFMRSGVGAIPELGRGISGLAKGAKLRDQIAKGQYDKSLYVSYYAMATMLYAGTMTFALTGEAPKDIMDYIYPRTGEKNADGSDARVSTPFYTKEAVSIPKHVEEEGLFGGIAKTIGSKLNPVGEVIKAIATNKDYFNREISDPNLSRLDLQRIMQQAEYVITSGQPIWSSAHKRAPGSAVKADVLAASGFAPAPKYATESPIEGKIASTFHKYHNVTIPYEKALYGQDVGELKLLKSQGKDEEYSTKLDKLQEKYNLSEAQVRRLEKNMDVPSTVRMFKQLSREQQIRLFKEMSPQERETYFEHLPKKAQKELEELGVTE